MGSSVAAAQRVLASNGAAVSVDGVWGRRTQAAYDAAPANVQQSVALIFRNEGKIPPWEIRVVSPGELRSLVHRAAGETGMIEYESELFHFVELEAPKVSGGFDANAQNHGSKGLMQMQRAAWSDCMAANSSLGGYEKVFDPYQNVLAGVTYAKINAKGLRRRGLPVTGKNLYLAHNQGIGYFDGKRTNVEGQSKIVQAAIKGTGNAGF